MLQPFPLVADFIAQLSAARSIAQAYQCAHALGVAAGYGFSGYVRKHYTQLNAPEQAHYSNWPENWLEHYQAQGCAKIDPALHLSASTGRAVVWHKALFEHQPALRRAMLGFGLNHGCTVVVRHHPLVLSVLSFAGPSLPDSAFVSQLGVIAHLLEHTTTQLSPGASVYSPSVARPSTIAEGSATETEPSAAGQMRRHHRYQEGSATAGSEPSAAQPIVSANTVCPLSLREIQVLRWTADGKSAAETALQLNITERTVAFHLGRVMQVLGAANKTDCVCKALMSGWLY